MKQPQEFGPRPIEVLVKAFETNYEIYSKDLRETGLVEDTTKLFTTEKDKIKRDALLNGSAALFSLPESMAERMRLIRESRVNSQDFPLSGDARHAPWYYVLHAKIIRQELGMDWRNAIVRALDEVNSIKGEKLALEQLKSGFVEKFAEMLDRILLVIPLVGKDSSVKDVIDIVKQAPAYGIINTNDELDLRAYLEDFDTTKGKPSKY